MASRNRLLALISALTPWAARRRVASVLGPCRRNRPGVASDDVDAIEPLAHSVPDHDQHDLACRGVALAQHYADWPQITDSVRRSTSRLPTPNVASGFPTDSLPGFAVL